MNIEINFVYSAFEILLRIQLNRIKWLLNRCGYHQSLAVWFWWNTEMKLTLFTQIASIFETDWLSWLVLWLVLFFENGQGKKHPI